MKKLLPATILLALISTLNLSSAARNFRFGTLHPVFTNYVIDTNAWRYLSNVDKMTSETNYYAFITANEKLQFEFPYNGGSTATFSITNYKKTIIAFLQVDKGQFVCNTNDCTVDVRFDSNPAMELKASAPDDGSTTSISLETDKKFLSQLKKAKTMIIRASFYQSGLQTMEFNVTGLQWNH
jgi:hypothetical protein